MIHDDALKHHWGLSGYTFSRHARWLFLIISILAKVSVHSSKVHQVCWVSKTYGIWDCKRFERVAKGELLESFVLNNFHIDTLFTFWSWFETSYQYRVLLDPRNPNKLWISSLFITFAPLRWMKARTACEAGGCKIWSSWIRLGRLGKRFHNSTLPEVAEGDPRKQQFSLVNHYTWPRMSFVKGVLNLAQAIPRLGIPWSGLGDLSFWIHPDRPNMFLSLLVLQALVRFLLQTQQCFFYTFPICKGKATPCLRNLSHRLLIHLSMCCLAPKCSPFWCCKIRLRLDIVKGSVPFRHVRSGPSACLVDVASEEGIQWTTSNTSQLPTMISIAKAGETGWNQLSPPKTTLILEFVSSSAGRARTLGCELVPLRVIPTWEKRRMKRWRRNKLHTQMK